MPVEQLVFVRRRSPDWGRLAQEYEAGLAIDPSRYVRNEVPGFPADLAARVQIWNEAFPVNFFRCRHLLKQISERTVSRIANSVMLSESCIREVPRIIADSQALLFFFDDDDLFAPSMFELVSAIEFDHSDIAVFPLVRLGENVYTFTRENAPARVIVGARHAFRYRLLTNNYGLAAKVALSSHLTHLTEHVSASMYADQRGLTDRYFDLLITATNKTPCSAVVIRELPLAEMEYRALIERYLARLRQLRLPRGAEWIRSPIEDTIRLFAGIAVGAGTSETTQPRGNRE